MTKLTSKNWVKVSVNQKNKTIRFTTQFYKTQSEGLQMLGGKAKNFAIVNKKAIDKMITDGFTIVEQKQQKVTDTQIVDLTGNPEVEEAIRQYYIKKKSQKAVHFSKGVTQRNQKCAVTAREVFGETKFKSEQPISVRKAYEKFERTRVGRERAMESTIR